MTTLEISKISASGLSFKILSFDIPIKQIFRKRKDSTQLKS